MTSQFQVLNKILQTKDFSIVLDNNLNENFFTSYENEFKFIRDHYEQYGTVPDRLTFASAFPEFDLFDVAEPNSFLLQSLTNDFLTNNLAAGFNKAKRLLESGKGEEAYAALEACLEERKRATPLSCTDLITDQSRYEHYKDRALGNGRQYYKTGFAEIDFDLGGIDPDNENMIIAARTGIGKTWTLLKMAVALYKQGLVVGIYSGEMTTDKVGYRIDTLLGGIDNRAITRGDVVVMEKYRKYFESLKQNAAKGAIKVITPSDINGPPGVPALDTFIKREHLDVLLVDQYSLLEDVKNHAKAFWEKVANISHEMKLLQVVSGIPIISVSQLNRTKSEEKGEHDTTQISGSDRIGQDATVVIMLDQDKKAGTLILNIVKARDGGEGKKYTYKIDLNSGEFIYINENVSAKDAQAIQDSYAETEEEVDDSPKALFGSLPWDN